MDTRLLGNLTVLVGVALVVVFTAFHRDLVSDGSLPLLVVAMALAGLGGLAIRLSPFRLAVTLTALWVATVAALVLSSITPGADAWDVVLVLVFGVLYGSLGFALWLLGTLVVYFACTGGRPPRR